MDYSVKSISGISDSYAKKLEKLGIEKVIDLITHFPRYYKDSSELTEINPLSEEGEYTVQGFFESLRSIRLRSKKTMQQATLVLETNALNVMWFNQPYIIKNIVEGEEYIVQGRLKYKGNKQVFYPSGFTKKSNLGKDLNIGRIVPQYSLTAGITAKWLRKIINSLIGNLELFNFKEYSERYKNLITPEVLEKSVRQLHFPESKQEYEEAKHNLEIVELAELLLKINSSRKTRTTEVIKLSESENKQLDIFIKSLPYELTDSQKTVLSEIINHIENKSSEILLQGDVGSGKTILAIIIVLIFIKRGVQIVYLAPTTVLAKQQYEEFIKFLPEYEDEIQLVLGSNKNQSPKLITIGTTAILARKDKLITNTGLIIIDEQHRFGVKQRNELSKFIADFKNTPHLLNMTATPIPRTLAQAIFGDIEVYHIKGKPLNRKPILTKIVPPEKSSELYKWIDHYINDEGSQVYWIAPLVEENENLNSVKELYKKLKDDFSDYEVDYLYGSLSDSEKTEKLERFASGKTKLLVSTTVIEVGINVPNANLIVIEHPERFGLAQLHQIRGRVGRGEKESWCFLMNTNQDESITERLDYFATNDNGLEIAEYDLRKRGPGEVYGTAQSGIPDLKIASIFNKESLDEAKELYPKIIKDYPSIFTF